jgi:hypothetical protein
MSRLTDEELERFIKLNKDIGHESAGSELLQELKDARRDLKVLRESLCRIEQGPEIPLYRDPGSPKSIALYTARWSQEQARKALAETERK